MNAITMKLESKQIQENTIKIKGKDSVIGKKSKNNRKKSSIANTDKDALLNDHGLGRKSGEINCDLNNSKSTNPVEPSCVKKSKVKKVCSKNSDKMLTTSKTMHERLQQILSPAIKEKISSILNDVKTLSDVEKLYLYLQLPTGSTFEADPFKLKTQNPLGKKADDEGMVAITWIQSHLEEDSEVSLPKQEVYDEYQSYCQMTGTDALCAADFGKVMKQIFPSVKPRRLGTRGNSRYCYSGLRKKLNLSAPTLPDLNQGSEISDGQSENVKEEVTSAACHILFEWAEKLLGLKFSSLKELASHLLENMYVDNRSVAAYTVLLEEAPELIEKGFSNCEGGVKKSEAQVHLQRKIQEKELIKEQKKKLQEHRSSISATNKIKLSMPKKKSSKSKKSKLHSEKSNSSPVKEMDWFVQQSIEHSPPGATSGNSSLLANNNTMSSDIKEEELDLELVMDLDTTVNELSSTINLSQSTNKTAAPVHSPGASLQLEDSPSKSTKIMIPRSKTPVCISQTLPGIIIVPSLPQLTDINKQNLGSPKYKRIQPKPLKGNGFSAVSRARAGSLGSTSVKPRSRTNDGRRSSHAWLQSVSSPETNENDIFKGSSNSMAIKSKSLIFSPQKSPIKKNCFIAPKEISIDKLKKDLQAVDESKKVSAFSDIKLLNSSMTNSVSDSSTTESMFTSNFSKKSSLPIRESSALKRPSEDTYSLKAKRRILDSGSSKASADITYSLSQEQLTSVIKLSDFPVQRPSIQQSCSSDEVSIHEIEGDALNDYYRGNNSQAMLSTSVQQTDDIDLSGRQLNFNKDISQLRMLLEQKITSGQNNSALLSNLKDVSKSDISSLHNSNDNLFYSHSVISEEEKAVIHQQQLVVNKLGLGNICESQITNLSMEEEKQLKNLSQLDSIDKFLDCNLGEQNEIISNADIYLNCKNQQIEVELSDLQQSLMNSNSGVLSAELLPNVDYTSSQVNSYLPMRVNTYTQVPSVPQSPNTRRRAFNFLPISPSHTPIPDTLINAASAVSSPVPNQYPRNMMSIGVGPSQPPSNAGSPFVSPRSTPVSTCRSRHSSGQSTSRHTPFQNFDSGVSSVSSSPFISPQPTPVPVSRLRHNSSHGSNKTVTFCSINSPLVINSLSTTNSLGQLRSRHNSGPGGKLSSRNAPLSPLVNDPNAQSSFIFPANNELRFRHSSDSNTASLSPVSEQTSSSSSCTSNLPDLTSVNDMNFSQSFLNDGAADLLINGNSSSFKQVRQRHASSSVIYSKSYLATKDPFSQEIQNLLKADQVNGSTNPLSNRSQSVPLHQMLQNLNNYCFINTSEKSQSTMPVMNNIFSFSNVNQENAAMSSDMLNGDKSFQHAPSVEWSGLESTGDLEASSAHRNIANLLDPPLSDDLQTTLEDLRDCDNDFSKFAQELELSQTEDGSL